MFSIAVPSCSKLKLAVMSNYTQISLSLFFF